MFETRKHAKLVMGKREKERPDHYSSLCGSPVLVDPPCGLSMTSRDRFRSSSAKFEQRLLSQSHEREIRPPSPFTGTLSFIRIYSSYHRAAITPKNSHTRLRALALSWPGENIYDPIWAQGKATRHRTCASSIGATCFLR